MKRGDFIKARVGGEVGRALDHDLAEHDHLRVIRERGVGLPSLLEPLDEGRESAVYTTGWAEIEPSGDPVASRLRGRRGDRRLKGSSSSTRSRAGSKMGPSKSGMMPGWDPVIEPTRPPVTESVKPLEDLESREGF
jgi:hypothetical protein